MASLFYNSDSVYHIRTAEDDDSKLPDNNPEYLSFDELFNNIIESDCLEQHNSSTESSSDNFSLDWKLRLQSPEEISSTLRNRTVSIEQVEKDYTKIPQISQNTDENWLNLLMAFNNGLVGTHAAQVKSAAQPKGCLSPRIKTHGGFSTTQPDALEISTLQHSSRKVHKPSNRISLVNERIAFPAAIMDSFQINVRAPFNSRASSPTNFSSSCSSFGSRSPSPTFFKSKSLIKGEKDNRDLPLPPTSSRSFSSALLLTKSVPLAFTSNKMDDREQRYQSEQCRKAVENEYERQRLQRQIELEALQANLMEQQQQQQQRRMESRREMMPNMRNMNEGVQLSIQRFNSEPQLSPAGNLSSPYIQMNGTTQSPMDGSPLVTPDSAYSQSSPMDMARLGMGSLPHGVNTQGFLTQQQQQQQTSLDFAQTSGETVDPQMVMTQPTRTIQFTGQQSQMMHSNQMRQRQYFDNDGMMGSQNESFLQQHQQQSRHPSQPKVGLGISPTRGKLAVPATQMPPNSMGPHMPRLNPAGSGKGSFNTASASSTSMSRSMPDLIAVALGAYDPSMGQQQCHWSLGTDNSACQYSPASQNTHPSNNTMNLNIRASHHKRNASAGLIHHTNQHSRAKSPIHANGKSSNRNSISKPRLNATNSHSSNSPPSSSNQHRRKSSNGGNSSNNRGKPAQDGFVNFTPADSHDILTGVAPSGSSKTKARREKEEAEKRRRLGEAAKQAVVEAAGGNLGSLDKGLRTLESASGDMQF